MLFFAERESTIPPLWQTKITILNIVSDLHVGREFTETNFEELCKKVEDLGSVDEVVESLEGDGHLHNAVLDKLGQKIGSGRDEAFGLLEDVFMAVGINQLNREKGIQRRF